MNSKIFKTAVFSTVVLLLSACQGERLLNCFEPELPPLSQVGANTMGCLWNGNPWENYRKTGPEKDTLLYRDFYNDGKGVILWGRLRYEDECNQKDQRLIINFDVITTDSIANLHIYGNDWGDSVKPGFVGYDYYMHPDEGFNFNVLRFSSIDKILSAEFNGLLIDTVAQETLTIEQGRMDVQFY